MPHRDPDARREYDRERSRQRTAERVARGLCPRCGRQASAAGARALRSVHRKTPRSRTAPGPSNTAQPASSASGTPRPGRRNTVGRASGPNSVSRGASALGAAATLASRNAGCAPPAASKPGNATGSDTRRPATGGLPTAAGARMPNGRAPGGAAAGAGNSGSRLRSAFVAGSRRRSRAGRVASPAVQNAARRTGRPMPIAWPREDARVAARPRSGPRHCAGRARSSRRSGSRPATPRRAGDMPDDEPDNAVLIADVPPASGRRVAMPVLARRTHAPNTSGVCPCTAPNSPSCMPAQRSRWACSRTGRT